MNRPSTFVIKQEELLPGVNIGDLIETDTGAIEDWTVNHCVPVGFAILRGLTWILTDSGVFFTSTLIVHY